MRGRGWALVTSGRGKNTGQYTADNSVENFVCSLYGRNFKLGFANPCFVRPSIYDLDHA